MSLSCVHCFYNGLVYCTENSYYIIIFLLLPFNVCYTIIIIKNVVNPKIKIVTKKLNKKVCRVIEVIRARVEAAFAEIGGTASR